MNHSAIFVRSSSVVSIIDESTCSRLVKTRFDSLKIVYSHESQSPQINIHVSTRCNINITEHRTIFDVISVLDVKTE